MKPLLSERQLLVGVGGRAVGGSLPGLCPARGGQGGVRHSWKKAIQLQGAGCGHTCPPPGPSIRSTGPRPHVLLATYRKRAVEAELDTCKAKLRAVEAQLLEVLEEKLRLRQEVEAWEVGWECPLGLGGTGRWAQSMPLNMLSCPQEDMQQLVRQRVESQLQTESRGTLRAPMEPGAAKVPWVRLPLVRWGRWQ